jgi:hypothetical protein
MEDVAAELETVRADFAGAYSRDDHVLRIDAVSRRARATAYSLRDLGGKLMFAASCYEEYAGRVKQNAEGPAAAKRTGGPVGSPVEGREEG